MLNGCKCSGVDCNFIIIILCWCIHKTHNIYIVHNKLKQFSFPRAAQFLPSNFSCRWNQTFENWRKNTNEATEEEIQKIASQNWTIPTSYVACSRKPLAYEFSIYDTLSATATLTHYGLYIIFSLRTLSSCKFYHLPAEWYGCISSCNVHVLSYFHFDLSKLIHIVLAHLTLYLFRCYGFRMVSQQCFSLTAVTTTIEWCVPCTLYTVSICANRNCKEEYENWSIE